ncbi:sensor domain-containing protein [Georgenia ruanii]|nr:EAL domain-containing protein [Georgenia ruanii]MPV89616.1 EAL domain-containing protein [Georgenia ruanii]
MSIDTEHFFAELIRSTDAAIVGWGEDRSVQLWSPALERLLGYREDEALGRDGKTFLVDPDPLGAIAARADVQTRLRHRDGSIIDVLLRAYPVAHPITTGPARPVAVWAVLHDITEQKRRERLAESTARRLAQAQEMAHVGSFEIDLVTQERWWSAEFWRILGLRASSTRPARELHLAVVHPDDLAAVGAQWERLDRGEPGGEIEYRIVRPSGEVRWVRTRATVAISELSGHPVITGTTMDVSDVRDAYRQTFQAERSFQAAFQRAPIGMAVVDLDMRLQQVNPALCAITGLDADELVGAPTSALMRPNDPAATTFEEELPHDPVKDVSVEREVTRRDGSSVWVAAFMSLMRDEHGEPAQYFLWVEDISERKRQERSLVHQAFHDPLTGLPNRKLLTRRLERSLERARRTGQQAAVLFIDVDEFKMINDSLGHGAGDRLLVELTQRLASVLSSSDMLARFGGDEFVAVCDHADAEDADRLAARIAQVTASPFVLGTQDVFVTVSVGITMATGHETISAVLRSSDSAMYQAKATGHGQSRMYTEDIHERATAKLTIASRLGRALEREELSVVYQPVVRLSDDRPVALEALLRWHDPERGPVSPLEFVPVAEETGLIVPIGEWVLRQALTQITTWRTTLPGCQGLGISVNVSGAQLRDRGFAQVVADAAEKADLDPAAIHLELTESIIMEDIEDAAGQLERLRAVGAQLAIDDFGTGYSALAYLSKLPATTLKIDRSFIEPLARDASAVTILRAIIDMARAAGLTTVAEGIETPSQKAQVQALGGELGQGFLWSRPLAAEDVPGWLAQHR